MINKAGMLKCTVFKNTFCGERERDASFHYGGTTVFNKMMGETQDAKERESLVRSTSGLGHHDFISVTRTKHERCP
jgi:hypothetical protein